ncbi:MAG: hypothetical protein LBI88_06135 [Deltaproteobacteria bacterium]|jgi:stage III sporulation protein SpoIIIAA|nr:hypothetical protein [Deltaproteobacteria bacterium]
MQKISLDQASAGMVLAIDVMTPDGRVLASEGTPLDDAMLRRLALAGVKKLVVQGKPVPGADMGYNALVRAQRLDHLFRAHQADRFMMTLKSMLSKHFTERF